MKTSAKGQLEIATYEGLCQKVYFDSVGVLTLGFGSTKTELANIGSIDKTHIFSIPECVDLFKKSLSMYENAINNVITVKLEQWEFDALVSWCYNIGTAGATRSTLVKLINQGAPKLDCQASMLKWDRPPEIRGRRRKEANLFVSGAYTANGSIEWRDTDGKGHETTRRVLNVKKYFTDDSPSTVQEQTSSPSRSIWTIIFDAIKYFMRDK